MAGGEQGEMHEGNAIQEEQEYWVTEENKKRSQRHAPSQMGNRPMRPECTRSILVFLGLENYPRDWLVGKEGGKPGHGGVRLGNSQLHT